MPFPLTIILGDPRLPDLAKPGNHFNPEDLDARDRMLAALRSLARYELSLLDDHESLIDDLRRRPPVLAVNFCDTGFRNQANRELNVAALLEILDIPYTGSPPACMATCFDKSIVRGVAIGLGIPVPDERYFHSPESVEPKGLLYPALIKPNQADGSVGITEEAVVRTPDQARRCLGRLARELPGRAVLFQEYLSGTEYGVGLLGNQPLGPTPLPPLEVDYSRLPAGLVPILGYESKTIPGSPYWTDIRYHEASLDPEQRRQVQDWSKALFVRLGCRDYARFDWRTDARGNIKLLEVNPNPAWGWDGKLAMMAGFAGLSYAQLLDRIIGAARQRTGV
jgi:D-alanine-D-alanine ligase